MTASELNGMAVIPFEEQIAEARERYMTICSDALDAELGRLVIPADRIAMLEDYAKFSCFLATLKTVEVQTPADAKIDRKAPLRAWKQVSKKLHDEVAAMLLDFGIEAERASVKGTGNAAS